MFVGTTPLVPFLGGENGVQMMIFHWNVQQLDESNKTRTQAHSYTLPVPVETITRCGVLAAINALPSSENNINGRLTTLMCRNRVWLARATFPVVKEQVKLLSIATSIMWCPLVARIGRAPA